MRSPIAVFEKEFCFWEKDTHSVRRGSPDPAETADRRSPPDFGFFLDQSQSRQHCHLSRRQAPRGSGDAGKNAIARTEWCTNRNGDLRSAVSAGSGDPRRTEDPRRTRRTHEKRCHITSLDANHTAVREDRKRGRGCVAVSYPLTFWFSGLSLDAPSSILDRNCDGSMNGYRANVVT